MKLRKKKDEHKKMKIEKKEKRKGKKIPASVFI